MPLRQKRMEKRYRSQSTYVPSLEEYMLDIMYEIPKDDSIGEVVITKGYIEGNGAAEDPSERTGSTPSWK